MRERLVPTSSPPPIDGLLESCLYVADLESARRFYEAILGFVKLTDLDDRGCALRVSDRQLLLLFRKGASLNIHTPHDGNGELHVTFAIAASQLPRWEEWLAKNGVSIEERTTWPRGGHSVYFRDPDRHLVELATPGVWPIY